MLTLILSLMLQHRVMYWCEGDRLCHYEHHGHRRIKVCWVSYECSEQN